MGCERGLDDAQVVRDVAERNVFLADGPVGSDHQHVLARLLGADGGIGHEQRLVGRRARDLHAGKHPGREQIVGVGEMRAAADRAGGAIDDVVDEVHAPAMGKILLVDQLEHDRRRGPAPAALALLRQPLVAQVRRLVERELEPDRVGRHDSGEQRGGAGSAGHQVAGRDSPVADAAGDRGTQLGELEIELGLAHRRLDRGHGGFGVALGLGALLEHLLGNRPIAHELLAARQIAFRVGEIRLGGDEIGARLIERVLEWPLVDGEQEIALLDDLAVGEMHAVEIAGDPSAHFDRVDGDEAADIVVVIHDGALGRLRDRHGGRGWRLRRLLLPLPAPGKQEDRQRARDPGRPRHDAFHQANSPHESQSDRRAESPIYEVRT